MLPGAPKGSIFVVKRLAFRGSMFQRGSSSTGTSVRTWVDQNVRFPWIRSVNPETGRTPGTEGLAEPTPSRRRCADGRVARVARVDIEALSAHRLLRALEAAGGLRRQGGHQGLPRTDPDRRGAQGATNQQKDKASRKTNKQNDQHICYC